MATALELARTRALAAENVVRVGEPAASDGQGGYAEQVAVPAGRLIPVPDAVDLRDAAAVLHDGTTALGLAAAVGFRPGEWVLVLAASGGMGLLLVQLARPSGARVAGAARGPAKRERIRAAGAEVVADYSGGPWRSAMARFCRKDPGRQGVNPGNERTVAPCWRRCWRPV